MNPEQLLALTDKVAKTGKAERDEHAMVFAFLQFLGGLFEVLKENYDLDSLIGEVNDRNGKRVRDTNKD